MKRTGMLETLGTRLKACRKGAGMTLKDFSHETRIPYTTLVQYENGAALPSILRLRELSLVLDVSSDFLIGLVHTRNHVPSIYRQSGLTAQPRAVGGTGRAGQP